MFIRIVAVVAYLSLARAAVRIKDQLFVDDEGRTLIFHGMNAVYKVAPWLPDVEGFDVDNSLSDVDAQNLKAWGFNIVRLGVMWPGLEPGNRGDYNVTYLDEIGKIVENLRKSDIYVILDLHQDLLHRKYCGEGVPDYVYESCRALEPKNTPPFPQPKVNETYPIDDEGNPELDSCLSVMFANYYLSAEVGAAFQCIYDNKDNMWDAMAGFWNTVAARFSGVENVLGYELINEPWAGDIYEDPKRLLPQVTEKQYLSPLYQHLHTAIRSVDDSKIIFFEGLTIDYWPNGFEEGPGGIAYNDRQALAYHIYCPQQNPTVAGEAVCQLIDDEFFYMRQKDADRMGVAMLMTEFGAAENIKGDIYALEKVAQLMDSHMQSWMYWQFKYYHDITTCTPEGETMYNADGTVVESKLRVLSRTYPQATAGALKSYEFETATAHFTMTYTPLKTISLPDVAARTSVIYFNQELHYSDRGVTVDVSVADGFIVECSASNEVSVVQTADYQGEDVTVVVSRCSSAVCTCANKHL